MPWVPRGCQREPLQPWVSSGLWDGHPLATFPWALADSQAGPHWHAWLSEYTRATDTSGSLGANSLAQNNWLDNKTDRQKNPEAQEACGVITCPVSWAEYFCRT